MAAKGDKSVSRVLVCSVGAGMLAGARTDANGVPVKSYVKDLVRVGPWVDPRTGDTFTITGDDLSRWTAEFGRMKANGVKVHVPEDHTDDPAKNRGYVEDMYHDGSTLFGRIDLIGEDAIKLASRTEVSIYAPSKFKDGQGNEYDNPITHVALTPVPVISGQGGFVPITLSRGGTERVPAFRFAQENQSMNTQLLEVAKSLGCDVSAAKTDEDLKTMILARHGAAKKETDQAVALYARERDEAKNALALARTEIEGLKKGEQGESNPRVIKLSRESRTAQLDALNPGNLTALTPVIAEAKAMFVPEDEKALRLSLTEAGDAMFDGFVRAFKKLDLKALAEQTRAGVALARTVPSNNGAEPKFDPEHVKEMSAL